jgi:hypothetical protein
MTMTAMNISRSSRRAQGDLATRPRIRDPYLHPLTLVITDGTETIGCVLAIGGAHHLYDARGTWCGAFKSTAAAMAALPKRAAS